MAAFIPAPRSSQNARREHLLWFLTFLFALRVAGQAIQRWAPQSFLPPFDAFQGSNLPYFVLLGSQIVTLGAMRSATCGAPAWFSTWIPAAFHLVLAGYVLALGCYRTETLQKS
jgi:hypothetical protein